VIVILLSVLVAVLATLRLTRFVTTDDLGLWTVKTPAYNWAARHEPPMPVIEPWDGLPEHFVEPVERIRVPGWRLRLVSGLECPFCVGFWIGVIVLGLLWLAGGPEDPAEWWWFGAGVFALNYVAGHVGSRLDG